ncbi:MAG: hypothetical protein SPL21_10175 [Fibrobacter sp.]|nr:hypothetical protein [Fibrobacter sp.]
MLKKSEKMDKILRFGPFFSEPWCRFFIAKKSMALDRWMVDEWLKGV